MRTIAVFMIMSCCMMAFAANSTSSSSLVLKSPQVEIAELEARIAAAKEAGFPADPAWTARIRELIPLVKGHASKVPADLPMIQVDGGFAPGAVIRPTELTPLEQQIKELEFQIDGGLSSVAPDEITRLNLKDQLNELYAQRVVRDPANPLDQGNDVCPATPINGLPYTDTGTTTGYANNYNPADVGFGQCFNNSAPDVVYSFVPPYTQSYTITTDGSSYDTYLYIQQFGTCPGDSTLECDDDDGIGLQSLITRTLTAGVTYYIVVDGFSSRSGNYVLNVFDNCNVNCNAADIQECFESRDSTHAQVNCNGGCENPIYGGVESWQDIQPCQTVCSRLFTYIGPNGGNFRDVDAYRFTLTEACSLAITLNSEVGYSLIVSSGSCPWDFVWFSGAFTYPCSTATHITPCFQPGTYSVIVVPNTFAGINDFRTYRMRMDLVPCSGCQIDAFFQAPGSAGWNTCGAGNNNSLRPSEDYTYCVNIPYDGEWTFSTCNDDSIWDSYIYLSTQCNGGVIAQDDDACGGIGLSVLRCVPLTAGTYYLTVEGWSFAGCGPFVLNVFECVGSCCYGDPVNPSCDFVGPNECSGLSGLWTNLEPCSTGACFTRPDCGDGEVMFSQVPFLPDEDWNANQSDLTAFAVQYENYSVPSAIGSIRFWGAIAEGGSCNTDPQNFEILFIDSVNNVTQTYNVTLTATVLPLVYFGQYPLLEYTAELNPPCTIANGWVRVAEATSGSCTFYWSRTVLGNGQVAHESINGGAPYPTDYELSFCLDQAPCEVDSVTFNWDSPGAALLRWRQNMVGQVTFWFTTDPNAVFPAGFLSAGTFPYAGGYNVIGVNANFSDYLGFVLTLDCSIVQPAAAIAPPPVLNIRRDGSE